MKKGYFKLLTLVSIFGIFLSSNFSLYSTYTIVNNSKIYNTSNRVDGNTITYYNHSTNTHTYEQIKSEFSKSLPSQDYTVVSPYKSGKEPVFTGPNYYEGEITDSLINDTLENLNYYRWLSGLTPVTLNSDKMHRNQKGALIQSVNDVLTHWPTRPDDMNVDFYNYAYAGTGAGTDDDTFENYTGNVSWGTYETMVNSIDGYISDIHNVKAGVGHRSSMLDPFAQRTSFGFAGQGSYTYGTPTWSLGFYTAVSNYRTRESKYNSNYVNPGNNEDFYPYPTSGLFPVESTPARADGGSTLSWSVRLMNGITYNDNTTIDLVHNGTTYNVARANIHTDGSTISWVLPNNLLNLVVAGNNSYLPGEKIDVYVKNLVKDSNVVNLEYSVDFISVNPVEIETIDLLLNQYKGNAAWVITNNFTFSLEGRETTYGFRVTPSNASITKFNISVSDPSILTVDESRRKVVVHKPGTAVVTLTEVSSGKSFKYTLRTNYIEPEVNFKNDKVTIGVGNKIQLNREILPNTFTPKSETYTSSDPSVVSVSTSGLITGLKEGSATITYTGKFNSKDDVVREIVVTVNEKGAPVKGDISGDGEVNLTDILIELKIFFKSISPNSEQSAAADVNGDGEINLTDILMLLKLFFNK